MGELAWDPEGTVEEGKSPLLGDGDIHIPYEGACGADLFIVPKWHNFLVEKLKRPDAKLRWAVGKYCNYIRIDRDFGQFECATKTTLADWVLFKSKGPYQDCNPVHDAELEAMISKAEISSA